MGLTKLQSAAIENALRTLEQRPDYSHSMALIRRVAGAVAVTAVRQLHKELVDANKAKTHSIRLSADAHAYDLEVRQLIVQGKRAQSSGNRDVELRVSRMSERLEESFEERVPNEDRAKFLKSEGDGQTWDDRWNYMEFRPPLLRPEYMGAPFAHPMNVAQRTVLTELVGGNPGQNTASAINRLEQTLKLVRSTE